MTRTAETAGRTATGWQPNRNWSRLDAGNTLELSTTDQRYRGGGWVFHVTFDGMNGGDTLYQQGGHATEDDAKRSAEDWLRQFCATALAALASKAGGT